MTFSKFCYFNGGLGNQTFQYIFSRFVELLTGTPVLLDDSFFFVSPDVHNGYELEHVFPNIKKPNLLSRYFGKKVWDFMIEQKKNGKSIPDQLLENGMDLLLIAETDNYTYSGVAVPTIANEYNPRLAHINCDVYYHGYWINKEWMNAIKPQILTELEFPAIVGEKNKFYASEIENTNSVCIHIRRGDFVTLGWDYPSEYYHKAIQIVSNQQSDANLFIFSDDLDWCRENSEELGLSLTKGNVTYVEGNFDKVNNYVDIQLMSMCKHMIFSRSSFSYLACLLNKNEEKIVINPRSY